MTEAARKKKQPLILTDAGAIWPARVGKSTIKKEKEKAMKETERKTELVKRNNARVLAAMGVAPKPSIKKEEKEQADLDSLFQKLSRLKAEVKETVEEITDAIWKNPNLRYTPLPNSGFTYSLGKYNMQWE
tara:strand:+ start:441 stop:833 length:393 start_codon:yes stop_codon:yes gene_type:complete